MNLILNILLYAKMSDKLNQKIIEQVALFGSISGLILGISFIFLWMLKQDISLLILSSLLFLLGIVSSIILSNS